MDNHQRALVITPFFRLTLFSICLTFCVIVLGAYTRLTEAGLGCPDWPGCYGKWIAPTTTQPASPTLSGISVPRNEAATLHSPTHTWARHTIDHTKAWTEMLHRYLAGSLGLTLVALAMLAIRNRRRPHQPIVLPIALIGLVILQSLLGMWTVTLKLHPLVVAAHLAGGMTTLALLWWLALRQGAQHAVFKMDYTATGSSLSHSKALPSKAFSLGRSHSTSLNYKFLKIASLLALILLALQILLGGWTSANYAALVCLDFPFCNVNHPIDYHYSDAFAFQSISLNARDSLETPLRHSARVAIHMLHRINALFTTISIVWLAVIAFYHTANSFIRKVSIAMILLLILQIVLGITNVLALLPLPIAMMHNAGAALLLLAALTLTYFAYAK